MKLQAHLPAFSVGARDWRGAKIVLVSLAGAAALVAAMESGILLNNPLIDALQMSSVERPQISGAHRVSLALAPSGHDADQMRRFSVAHPLRAQVTPSQRYSIGADARAGFENFGDAALRDLASRKTEHKFGPRNDQMMLMLMLVRLRPRRY
jgi:hypothetical protein